MAGTETYASGDGAQQPMDAAKEKAQDVRAQAGEQLRKQVDERSTQAGDQLDRQVQDVRAVGDQLRDQGKDGPAKLAEQVADRGERLSSYLRDSDSDRIVRDLEQLGRKQPLAVVAGGIVVGFVASRFLKASSRNRSQASPQPVADRTAPALSPPAPVATPTPVTAPVDGGADLRPGGSIPTASPVGSL
ncbi:MAG: hypothetical protein JWP17_3462 [Solirubrobacterales bacterium]|jgi:hypothetical protein|nr:hypothetical protein [Solirubrobacterales bacterium]